MLTEQRHEIILNLLSEKGSITVTELKDILNTSESTIRRDLNTLDEQGRLTKVFGGAVEKINGVSTTELSVSQKADVNTEELMWKLRNFLCGCSWTEQALKNILNLED